MNTYFAAEREEGFSLVELLVVIVIIGILSVIAIGAFMEQRKRANDAAVESDVKMVATTIESEFVDKPNAEMVGGYSEGNSEGNNNFVFHLFDDAEDFPAHFYNGFGDDYEKNFGDSAKEPTEPSHTEGESVGREAGKVYLSDGVYIFVYGEASGYYIIGWHKNGEKYTEWKDGESLVYESTKGGFVTDSDIW